VDKNLYAINPDGTEKWSFATGGIVNSSPAIGGDGTIFVGSVDKNLYAINPDGTEKWSFATDDAVTYSSPAIGGDNTIYIGSNDYKFYAINPDGTEKWSFATGGIVNSSPAIGGDGTVYVGSMDKNLYAINPDGTEKWSFVTGGIVNSSPAIGEDGTIYVGSNDYKLYAINPDGTEKWSFATGGIVNSSPAIGGDGTIFVGSYDYNLYAIESKKGIVITNKDQVEFYFTNADAFQLSIYVNNLASLDFDISSCKFDQTAFSLVDTLPVTVPGDGSITLTATLVPQNTGFYQSYFHIYYMDNGISRISSGKVSVGIFPDDNSELSYTAHRAIMAYNECKIEDPDSIATKNNRGVLYRLLSEPLFAEEIFNEVLTEAQDAGYGFCGIKMNLGVTKSDQLLSAAADEFYDRALGDIGAGTSLIASQLYYNKAWEAFRNNEFTDAREHLDLILSYNEMNDFQTAKAYVLRSAVFYNLEFIKDSISDLQSALSLDQEGPIGRMAQSNLAALPDIYVSHSMHNFGNVYIGSSSSAQITITNKGDTGIEIGTISIIGAGNSEFKISQDRCSNVVIAPSSSSTFYIIITPTSQGEKSAVVEIPASDADTPMMKVSITGSGVSIPSTPSSGSSDSGGGGGGGGCFITTLNRR
jgi:tetratricopeptide (TPR) repeat protein